MDAAAVGSISIAVDNNNYIFDDISNFVCVCAREWSSNSSQSTDVNIG